MKDCNLKEVSTPVQKFADSLAELLRNGARDLIKQAVEEELDELLSSYSDVKLIDGRQAVVRNGYLPERTIQTGIGDVVVQVPKVRARRLLGSIGLSSRRTRQQCRAKMIMSP